MLYKRRNHGALLVRHILSIPFIIAPLPALILLDLSVELYHQVAFPLYGLKKHKRSNYIVFDREKLKYVGFFDKLYCLYCSYANGLLLYAVSIAGSTEKYFCGIKHRPFEGYHEPLHHVDFVEFGNEEEFKKRYIL